MVRDRAATLTLRIATAVVTVSMVLGVIGAIAGGDLGLSIGSGPGGLAGFPMLALFGNVVVGMVAGSGGARMPRARTVMLLAVLGPALVALSFLMLAHRLDPCLRGWWDMSSGWVGAPLCESFEAELNTHTRFHLLLHASIGAPAVVLYGLAVMVLARRRTTA